MRRDRSPVRGESRLCADVAADVAASDLVDDYNDVNVVNVDIIDDDRQDVGGGFAKDRARGSDISCGGDSGGGRLTDDKVRCERLSG
jgi:hypothetical protein